MTISIHALLVEGDMDLWAAVLKLMISIHALRVEGDRCGQGRRRRARNFYPRPPGGGRSHFSPWKIGYECISIHALRVEGDDGSDAQKIALQLVFLSTPSGWRATQIRCVATPSKPYFYPRPPGGGRPSCTPAHSRRLYFYPRPPGGGRQRSRQPAASRTHFYPRPPGGGRQNQF